MIKIKSDKIILQDGFFDGYVYVEGERIISVSKENMPAECEYDATGCYVSAGFIDMHTHGGGGNPFEGSVEQIVAGCNFHLAHGTTTICPTVSAAPLADMARSVRNIKAAMADER
ncbi:MAG: amidohydrolase family protein, partial [Clostridia bacterium]|nr:amidohydrolase family protein [Clostridia bacterium]